MRLGILLVCTFNGVADRRVFRKLVAPDGKLSGLHTGGYGIPSKGLWV